ncbi:MAG: cyclic nucleotide-binding domain-containing protein [Myxococcales bacterium]|nr:cyclic nucleotide-binding domain-containing protein [Myxococcales bacterium]
MSKLKELEKRLQNEPGNLGLRIMLASAYRDVARLGEAIDLYRSVAIAYRDQGRVQQAIAVCKSVLELAPNDVASKALLAALTPPAPASQSVPPVTAAVTSPDVKAPLRDVEVDANLDVGTLVAAPVIPARPAIQIPTQPMAAVPGPRSSAPSTPPPTPTRPLTAPTRPPPAITPPTPTPALIPPFRTSSPLRDASSQSGPLRRPSGDETPLPRAVPHHVHDPTTANIRKLSSKDLITNEHATPASEPTDAGDTIPGGRPSEQTPLTRPSDTQPRVTRPSDTQPRVMRPSDTLARKKTPSVAGIANAARRISTSLMGNHEGHDIDIAQELDTRQRPKVDSEQIEHLASPPPTTAPFRRNDLDDDDEGIITPVPLDHREDERTNIRELSPSPARLPPPALPILGTQFFAPLPADKRAAVLGRFQKKLVNAGTTVIRQGEIAHPLVLVAKGRLDVRAERADGRLVQVGTVATGEYVGEVALLHRVPAAAHVIAAGDAEILMLPPRDFYELAGAFPALWAELKDVAERRQREHDFRVKTGR